MAGACLSGLTAALILAGAVHVHAWLAWAVGVPLAFLTRNGARLRHALLAGCAFGIPVAFEQVPWVAVAVRNYFGLSAPAATAGVAGLAAICGAFWGTVLGVGVGCAARAPAAWRAVLVGAAWVTWERLLLAGFPSYPWVSLAATQVSAAPVLAAVGVLGSPGLSLVVVTSGAALGGAWLAAGEGRRRARCAHAVLAVLLPAFALAVGAYRAAGHQAIATSSRCAITGVDAEIQTGDLPAEQVLERYEKASAAAAGSAAVVWPESAVPGYPLLDPVLQARLREVARQLRAVLIAGGPRIEWSGAWQPVRRNSAYRVEGQGRIEYYDKRVLVPLAEYWPAAAWVAGPAWIAAHAVAPGERAAVFRAGPCRFGVLLCSEAERSDLAREAARSGADALLVLSNDAHLPSRGVTAEIAQVRLRAAETGLWAVRVANGGRSVAIDPLGRVAAENRGGALRVGIGAPVPAAALVLGPAIERGCAVIALCALALPAARWVLRRRAPSGAAQR